MLGVNVNTVVGWEVGRKEPKLSYIPTIIGFLGYDPFSGEMSFGERLRAERWKLGLTQYQLAHRLGVYKHTITLLETGKEVANKKALATVRAFVEAAGGV
jgi:DNA-binding XRE family transcriptional regulator